MTEVFAPYWEWEDYMHGMYEPPEAGDLERLAGLAASMLSDAGWFGATARQVVEAWPVASAVNLTSRTSNRRAWVGQASCSFGLRVPEVATRAAWKTLAQGVRDVANDVADEVIREYERERAEIHRNVVTARLFGRDS